MTGIERIEEIRARLAKATPSTVLFSPWGESDAYRDTVHFFSRSDTDIRDLLAEVRRQKERVEELEKVAKATKILMESKVFTWDAVTDEQIHKVITDVATALAATGVGGGE